MKRFLLDVNTLLALLGPMHVHHEAAHRWYANQSACRLILCSPVENGVIRVASQPKYPNCLGTSSRVRDALQKFFQKVNVALCKKEVSLLVDEVLLEAGSLAPSRVSDLYLLALAVANDARLATFDMRILAAAIAGGPAALETLSVS